MTVPYIFSTLPNGSTIPLSYLDADFAYLDAQINLLPVRVVDSIAELRLLTVDPAYNVTANGYYTNGDGGGGYFYPVYGASAGTYVDNGGTIIVPTAGDGSSAWIRIYSGNIDVKWFGAKGDYNPNTSSGTDDADAFNAAIDWVYQNGGGTVSVPPVEFGYCLNSQIWIKVGVTLLGGAALPTHDIFASTVSDYYGGYCLVINWGAGTTGTPQTPTCSAIRMSFNTGFLGFTIVYPDQVDHIVDPNYPITNNPVVPVVFPPTIGNYDFDGPGGIISNCFFVNSYIGMFLSSPRLTANISNIIGTILKTFIILEGGNSADELVNVSCSVINYLLGSPNVDFSNNNSLYSWVQKNGIGFLLGKNDAVRFIDCATGNCYAGIQFGQSPCGSGSDEYAQYTYGCWIGGLIEGATFPVNVQRNASSSVTITPGAPGIINWTNHGLQYGNGVQFAATTFPTGLAASTTYRVVSTPTPDTFEVSAAWGGAPIAITTAGSGVSCVNMTAGGINSNSFRFTNVGIAVAGSSNATRSIAVLYNQPTTIFDSSSEYRGNLIFDTCSFWGLGSWEPGFGPLEGLINTTGSDATFSNCSFNAVFQSYYIEDTSGSNVTKFYNCNFKKIDQGLTPVNPATGLQTVRSANLSCYGRVIFFGNDFQDQPTYDLVGSSTYATGYAPINVASASVPVIPIYGDYNFTYRITGTTNIDGISALPSGTILRLIFTGVLTVANANNLYLNGSSFVTANHAILVLISDGTDWFELSRSSNR